MKMKMFKVSAFVKDNAGGNMAGVVLDCEELQDYQMLEIAKELNFSETAFVVSSEKADFRVRFFTPLHEIDLCGHATIATFSVLRDLKTISLGKITQETNAGILELDIHEDYVFMQQQTPHFFDEVQYKDIEKCFDQKGFIDTRYPVIIGSTGLREIFVPIKSKKLLNSMVMKKQQVIELSKEKNVIGLHLFAVSDEYDAYCRNFAPIVGIDEESATGTSNGLLGAYFNKFISHKDKFTFVQGEAMGKTSMIKVQLVKGSESSNSVWVGGKAIICT
jgi:PhzF family phenazine biosynthesis protein